MNIFQGTIFSFVPALVAIALALITKEVYSSLFVGIVIGALFYSNFSFVGTFEHVINDGLIKVLSDPYNVGILIFLVILGILVALLNRSGGSKAFGEYAAKNIKSKTGALLATWVLGVLIFVDDYFNCLTVGSVMRPVTDKHNISRAKLAYIIDSTAAPICIIAPISSWAAAVSGFVEGEDGLSLFIKAIPYNYYALLTMAFIIITSILNINYGKMRLCENAAAEGNLFYGEKIVDVRAEHKESKIVGSGKVIDLILPIIILVILCVVGLIYSGGFFSGTSFIESFSNADASVGLVIGSLFTLIITLIYYLCRRILTFEQSMASIVEGFKNMTPAILILTFAWTLKAMTDSLEASTFVNNVLGAQLGNFSIVVPALTFIIAGGVSFATGTSWGTFGILIPIVVSLLKDYNYSLMIISISASMAGAVFGDHCSPISDTTIMSSAGAQCEHILHVSTQLAYAITVD
ncbi:MAG: Na+/H+ antiporter NhaC family protein, partial [Lachnospiraceae bacterium]|nr:Na+/H+ antiporter NhaC family protein [Lachnospiraceae bacterium]